MVQRTWATAQPTLVLGSGVVLRIGNVTVEIQRGFDPQVLTEVIRSLLNVC